MLNQVFELSATVFENTLLIFAISYASNFRFTKKKQILWMILSVFLMTIWVTIANQISSFSFFTVLAGFIYLIIITAFLSKGTLLLRSTISIITLFFLHILGYVFLFCIIFIVFGFQNVADNFLILMRPSPLRYVTIFFNKFLQLLFYFLLLRQLKQLQTFRKVYQIILFISFLLAYIMMSVLVNHIITGSNNLPLIFLIAWILIAICMIIILFAIFLTKKYNDKQHESELLAINHQLTLERNILLSNNQAELSKYSHDFHKHLETISGLSNEPKVQEYIFDLLQKQINFTGGCHSGNEIIDTIINSRQNVALLHDIHYDYDVTPKIALTINPTDICIILANQLDNAIEACLSIENTNERFINISITSQNSLVIFTVSNSAKENPFDSHLRLHSKKSEKYHGIGIKNIQLIAQKYNGNVQNTFENQMFKSTVLLQQLDHQN